MASLPRVILQVLSAKIFEEGLDKKNGIKYNIVSTQQC
jgi:hypothetical protein